MNIQTQIRDEFVRVDTLARSLFPAYARMSVPKLTFYIKGRAAGWAKYREWEVSINTYIAAQDIAEMKDTVSHEIAHIVTFAVYGERGHGARWKMVHRMLGGDGKRCYDSKDIKVIPGRRSNWYLYRCPNGGGETWVGPRHHGALQRGKYGALTNNKTGVRILAEHFTGQSKTK